MPKIVEMKCQDLKKGSYSQLLFICPGCNEEHCISTQVHTWNGSLDKPTFKASLLHDAKQGSKQRCHSFITDGNIQFLADCSHKLAGITVQMPDITEEYKQRFS
jgi:hypothetical protein